ncbi:MAG: M20 family metallopeptidase [Candidatus Thorarchaeota archaeon]
MKVEDEIKDSHKELITLRRDFHKHPELGFEEFRTSNIIAQYLEELSLDVKRGLAKTGVVGVLRGNSSGPTLLIRSDMDALPIEEQNDVSFKSVNSGIMHACGHDAHMSMLLIAAKILSHHKDKINGNIVFAFQPNEEVAGAKRMIEDGVLEEPKVDASFGLHVWSLLESGKIGVIKGPIMASSWYFKLTINGKGGHGGSPHTSVDPIICASYIIQAVQTIQTRDTSALEPTVITFGKINAGTMNIVIPESIILEGSIRCLHEGDERIRVRFDEIIKNICIAFRTTYELEFMCGNRLLVNEKSMTRIVKTIADQVVSSENVVGEKTRTMVGEDYAEFSRQVPSAFYFIGTKNVGLEANYPHHHPRFQIDEDTLSIGVEMHIKTALEYFKTYHNS